MKKIFLIMFIFICKNNLCSQHNYILDNVFELNLSLKMDFDSLKNLHPVKCSEGYLDSTTVTINGFVNNLDTFSKEYTQLGCWHKNKIKTYLLDNKDSLIIFLNFYNNKLIEVTIFVNDIVKILLLKYKLKTHFELKEFVHKGENKIEKFYFASYKDRYSYLVLSDRKASTLIPSWCGNGRKRRGWDKLDKYLASQK